MGNRPLRWVGNQKVDMVCFPVALQYRKIHLFCHTLEGFLYQSQTFLSKYFPSVLGDEYQVSLQARYAVAVSSKFHVLQ